MKKLIFMFALLVISDTYSQTILTASNNPIPGDMDMQIKCDTAGITQGNAGANRIWNYNSIIYTDTNNSVFVTAASTPYAAEFPGSNVALVSNSNDYNYYTTSSASYIERGQARPGQTIVLSDPRTLLQYPFAYEDSFTDNFAAVFQESGTTIYETGTLTATADAWGTINLPAGSFPNSLRIRYNLTLKDSSNTSGTPHVVLATATAFFWYAPGKKLPVFQVVYSSYFENGILQGKDKNVDYRPNSPTIGITLLNNSLPDNIHLSQNYPNPFNPSTVINFEIPSFINGQGNVTLKIYDVQGKEAAVLVNERLSPGSYEAEWNPADNSAGVYFYTLKTDGFEQTRKMILLK